MAVASETSDQKTTFALCMDTVGTSNTIKAAGVDRTLHYQRLLLQPVWTAVAMDVHEMWH